MKTSIAIAVIISVLLGIGYLFIKSNAATSGFTKSSIISSIIGNSTEEKNRSVDEPTDKNSQKYETTILSGSESKPPVNTSNTTGRTNAYTCKAKAYGPGSGDISLTVRSDQRMYSTGVMDGGAVLNTIYDGVYVYTWTTDPSDSSAPIGMKFRPPQPLITYNNDVASGKISGGYPVPGMGALAGSEYNCQSSSFDESRLIAPSNVEFMTTQTSY